MSSETAPTHMPAADARDASISSMPLGRFVDQLSAKQPTPGGGAAAPIILALAAALGRMVVAYSQGKKKLAEHEPMFADALDRLQSHASSSLILAEQDAAAYASLNELWKLPVDDPRRVSEWRDAVNAAIDVPKAVLTACLDVLEQLQQLVGRSSRMLASDLAIAAILADAAARAAAWNIRINLPQLADQAEATQHRSDIDAMLERAHALATVIEQACGESG